VALEIRLERWGSRLEARLSLFGVADVGGFAFPDGVSGGEEVDAFVVVDVAVLCDVVGADGAVDVEDDGFAVEGRGVELRGAGD
jgi:hypothetical protein